MTQTTQEKREDDAWQAWKQYAQRAYWPNGYDLTRLRKAFIDGYLAGREDGKIGV